MKTNEEYLRELIKDNDEANEWLDAIIAEHDEKIDELKDEVSKATERITELESEIEDEPEFNTINLGLDTLHYKLEHGNLLIQQRLESFIRSANTIPNAEPAML